MIKEVRIRGEYWIDNFGSVDFADGHVGDETHESIAIKSVLFDFEENIRAYAKKLRIKIPNFDEDPHILTDYLHKIEEKLTDKIPDYKARHASMMKSLGIGPGFTVSQDVFHILMGGGDAAGYCRNHKGWIAVRGNNVDLYGYDERKRRILAKGLAEILEDEGIDDSIPPEEIDFTIYDAKSLRQTNVTLADIESQQVVVRPNVPATSKGDRRFFVPAPPDSENTPNRNPSKLFSPWQNAAEKAGIINPGQKWWAPTSEHFSFKNWLLSE